MGQTNATVAEVAAERSQKKVLSSPRARKFLVQLVMAAETASSAAVKKENPKRLKQMIWPEQTRGPEQTRDR